MRSDGALTLNGYKTYISETLLEGVKDEVIKNAIQKYLKACEKDIETRYRWYLDGLKMGSPNAVAYELDLEFVPSEWT